MRVFRCITAREITNLYKEENIYEPLVKGQNTHKYDSNTDYIHFFRYSASAQYYKDYNWFDVNHLKKYILFMTANIPNEVLNKYFGYGFYDSDGMDVKYGGYIPLPEYAIPKDEFLKEYIVEVDNEIYYYMGNIEIMKLYVLNY